MSRVLPRIDVPDDLVAFHRRLFGDDGKPWIAALPDLAASCFDRWQLRPDGIPRYGSVALVLPVIRTDGTPGALKLQPIDDQTTYEPIALHAWDGDGAVRLLEHDPDSGSMLLERLDADHTLWTVRSDLAAIQVISELLVRLGSVPAPEGLRRLDEVAAAMLDRVPHAVNLLADPSERQLFEACAGAVRQVCGESGDRLLHWDLHYSNVLAPPAGHQREPWLAIDPKPMIGDQGFELLPALWSRWNDVVATGDVPRAVWRRFDLMTSVVGLDRQRAAGWTLGRILQEALSDVERLGEQALRLQHRAVAEALLTRPAPRRSNSWS